MGRITTAQNDGPSRAVERTERRIGRGALSGEGRGVPSLPLRNADNVFAVRQHDIVLMVKSEAGLEL